MRCDFCQMEFAEKDIHESHDVPCYLFDGNRQGRKNQADKFGRHWLCKNCHEQYEKALQLYLREQAKIFIKNYEKGAIDGNTNTTTKEGN